MKKGVKHKETWVNEVKLVKRVQTRGKKTRKTYFSKHLITVYL